MVAINGQLAEVFRVSQDPTMSEMGGSHAQKGIDFQRFWALVRIFELKQEAASDFLLLFESVQDVAELDSEHSPSIIDIYQIKKKDGGEWSFNSLSGLAKPDRRKKATKPSLATIEKSPIGKLYKAGLAFQNLQSRIHFVSNAGCDLPLSSSGQASSRQYCFASDLDTVHVSALTEGLTLFHSDSVAADLTKIALRKTALHPDEPHYFALGAVTAYLTKEFPLHAGQAKALVDALFMQLSTLGRQTEPVQTFEELRRQRGFSLKQLNSALADLQKIPDLKQNFDHLVDALVVEGLAPMRRIAVNVGASKYFSSLVSGMRTVEEQDLLNQCAQSASDIDLDMQLLSVLNAEVLRLAPLHPTFKESEIFAYLLIQVTKHASA